MGTGGPGALTREQLAELKEAGCDEVLFNVNGTKAGPWQWYGGKAAILRGAETVASLGMTVGWMPWVWCNPSFMAECGDRLVELTKDFGGPVRLWQLDWEGSAETSARRYATHMGITLPEAVRQSLHELARRYAETNGVMLGATTLYFRRPAGDALLKWQQQVDGRTVRIEELLVQTYSIWNPKKKSTHSPDYQPGILQRRGWDNYAGFQPSLHELGLGLNSWMLDRSGPDVPVELRMTAAAAMHRAVEAALDVGAEQVGFWAGHLINSDSAVEKHRWELTLSAIRRLKGTGPAILTAPEPATPTSPEGVHFKWDEQFEDRSIIRGGRPDGYRSLRGVQGAPRAEYTEAATYLRARDQPLGTCTPFETQDWKLLGVDQLHYQTFRGGKRVDVPGGIHGITVFLRSKPGEATPDPIPPEPGLALLDAAKVEGLLSRARSALGLGIAYGLGRGGTDPTRSRPDHNGLCDCSGFMAWVVGLSRRKNENPLGRWFETTNVYNDAKMPSRGKLFTPLERPQIGSIAVYPDRATRQGHMGLVTQVDGGLVGIDCSSSVGISERSFTFFLNNPKTIFVVLHDMLVSQ